MFYRIDGSRWSMREFWFDSRAFFWVGFFVKFNKTRIRISSDDAALDSLEGFAVEGGAIPLERMTRFTRTLDQLAAIGFETPAWIDFEDPYQATRNTIALLRHSSGKAFARVQCRTNFARQPAATKFFSTIISKTPGGYVVTGNGKYQLTWPKSHDVVRHRTMAVAGVWAAHQQRMPANVQPIGANELLDAAGAYHVALRDFHLQRGVFEPISEAEQATFMAPKQVAATEQPLPLPPPPLPGEIAYARAPTIAPPAQPDMLELATLDELLQLQNRKVNLRSMMFLLVLSAGLFIYFARGSSRETDWEYIGMLVGLLLFHELGHFVAMKLFGYRNLRMFFIPGLGAAVTGRNYNAPAWKKIVVSLMGPLPGIVLGAGFLLAAQHWHQELLFKIGLVAIILNAFNLIPLLPFDGGWVAHAALFARHPKFDIGFRIFAALAILAIGLLVPGMRFFPYVALATLFTLPVAYRQANIVGELRRVPGLGESPDSQTIPVETARVIFAHIRKRFPIGLTAKTGAMQIANVFGSLNARPPSIAATLALLSVHAGAFVFGAGAIWIALLMRSTAFQQNMYQQPTSMVSAQQLSTNGVEPHGERNTLVARFKSPGEAYAMLGTIDAKRPAMQFGQTLFVDFQPDESDKQKMMLDRFSKSAEGVFVESDKARARVEISLQLPPGTEAKLAFDQVEEYLRYSRWRLTPPWAGDDVWPVDQRKDPELCRVVLNKLQHPPEGDPALLAPILQQMDAAEKRGDDAETERLRTQYSQIEESAQARHVEALRKEFGHKELVDKWLELTTSKDHRSLQKRMKTELAPMLGQWPANKPNDLLARSGAASDFAQIGTSINLQFYHVDTGLPAMMRWLFAHGMTDVHYSISEQPIIAGREDLIDDDE